MKLNISLDTKYAFIVFAAALVIGSVIAYNNNWASSPGNPAIVGHSPDEVVGNLKCTSNQALTLTPSGWSCVSVQSRVSGACPASQSINTIRADGSVVCVPGPPSVRTISCTCSGYCTCFMYCATSEYITYASGCGAGYSYSNAYTMSCTSYGGGGTATCTSV